MRTNLKCFTTLTLTLVLFLLLVIPYKCFIGTHFLDDLSNRLEANDSYISSYYFWWTSATYLSSFLWLLVLYWILSTSVVSQNSSQLALILISLLTLTELNDLVALNQNWNLVNYTNVGLNTLLTNSLNYYHPLILYSSFFSLTSILFLYNDSYYSSQHYAYPSYAYLSDYLSQIAITLSLIALFLGSWWAVQEGTWGGWWNWDASEVLGWLVSLYFLTLLHSLVRYQLITVLRSKQLLLWKSILLVYLLVQVSFELTAHNFGIKFFYFFNNNLFLLEAFIIVFLGAVNRINGITQYYRLVWERRKLKFFTSSKSITRLSLVLATLSFVIISIKPLVSYLLWTFINIHDTTNFYMNFVPSFIILFAFYTVLLFTRRYSFGISCFYIGTSDCWLWIFLLQLRSRSLVYLLHWLIMLFTTLNFSILFFDLSYWYAASPIGLVVSDNALWVTRCNSLTLSSWTLELSCVNYTVFDKCVESWVIMFNTNSPYLNLFALEVTHHSLRNVYQLGETYATFLLSIELTFTLYLSIIINLVLWVYLSLLRPVSLLT